MAWPLAVWAMPDVSASGCFVRTSTGLEYTVRLSTPECSLIIDNSDATSQTAIITLENLDPDFVTVTTYDAASGVTRTDTNLRFALTVGANAAASTTIAPWYTYSDDFYYVALSDNQARGTVETNPIFEDIVQQISVINPVFFTNSGDLVQGSTDAATLQGMFAAVQTTLADTTVPMYPVSGNHDYGTGLDIYEDYFGSSSYSFTFADTLFIGVSTAGSTSKGVVSDEQLSWLTSLLADTTVNHTVVYFHHPLVAPSWGSSSCCFEDSTNRDNFRTVLEAGDIDLAMAGHSQGYDYSDLLGIYQLVTGGAGGTLAQPDGEYHFILAQVTPAGISHDIIVKDDFATVVDQSVNDGTADAVTAEVVNTADTDVGYIRLKFRIAADAPTYLISDDRGNYYHNFFEQRLEEYTVLYVETTAPANSTVTYTAAPAKLIHQGYTNTVTARGYISYDRLPGDADTAVSSLNVLPGKRSTDITDLTVGTMDNNYRYSWSERPRVRTINSTYTITDLPNNRLFAVVANDTRYALLASDTTGTVSFRYTRNSAERNFELWLLDDNYLSQVIVAPTTAGTPHIRLFTSQGKNIGNWLALDQATTGGYVVHSADVTGDRTPEVIVATTSQQPQLGIYTLAGEELATRTIPDIIALQSGDITGDGAKEIVTLANTTAPVLAIYRYRVSDRSLHLLAQRHLPATTTQSDIVVADITDDAVAEVIVLKPGGQRSVLSIYHWADNRLQLTDRTALRSSCPQTALAVGRFTTTLQPMIAVLCDKLWFYRLASGDQLILTDQVQLPMPWTSAVQLTAARLQTDAPTTLLLWSATEPELHGYRFTKTGHWRHWLDSSPYGDSYAGGVQVGVIDSDGDWNQEIVTSQFTDSGKIIVWEAVADTFTITPATEWYAYDQPLAGGVNFAQ